MTGTESIGRLRENEAELRAAGIASLSLFGSVARRAERPDSDVDDAVTLRRDMPIGLGEYATLADRLHGAPGGKVDMVSEPSRRFRLQPEIDRDRVHVS